jgi:tRNA (mo5U34)-methyltransferase
MTPDEIRKGVQELGPWFHFLHLGNGIVTKDASVGSEPLDHPCKTWEKVRAAIPADLSGKSVLDVGCNAGFYSIEMKRRGAGRVLAVDSQRDQVNQAAFASEVLGLEIETSRLSVYDLDPVIHGQFDLVLALGLIYHCKHLIQALERLFTVTRDLLVLETAIYPRDLAPRPVSYNVGGIDRTLDGIAYVENPPDAKEAVFNWFLPSVEALVAMVENIGFDSVDVFEGEHPERIIIACHKKEPYPDSRALAFLDAELKLVEGPTECAAGSDIKFVIGCRNTGAARWLRQGLPDDTATVRLGLHIYSEGSRVPSRFIHERYGVPHDVLPGDTVEIVMPSTAPSKPGRYTITFDMVTENLAWFDDLGSEVLEHEITVT